MVRCAVVSGARCIRVVSLLALACGSSPPDPVVDAGTDAGPGCPYPDADLDGFGDAACGGPDCDDQDPAVHTAAECRARCVQDEHAATCACTALEPETCYTGPAGTLGVGECRQGLRSCRDGAWGPCQDETRPRDEWCNLVDDDCDGQVDEAVLDECGVCDSFCRRVCVGNKSCLEGLGSASSSGLTLNEGGCLELEPRAVGGRVTIVLQTEEAFMSWNQLTYDAVLPGRSTLTFEVRTAGSLDDLPQALWTNLGHGPSPIPLDSLVGDSFNQNFLEVRVTLVAPDGEAPRLCRVAVDYSTVILI